MLASLALSVVLATSPGGKTLWLVEPLYPGQEQLLGRTETAVRALIRPEERNEQIVGKAELVAYLKGRPATGPQGVLTCLVDGTCKDPLDHLMKGLGFARVHLVRSGQDESGYRVRLATYRPTEGLVGITEGSNATLDKSLLGALVKVDQLISTLEVTTTPAGANVLIDGERVGVTPLTTQVLPGERTLELTLPGYMPVKLPQNVPVKGVIKVERALEKVPARIVADLKPDGTELLMDGKVLGHDRIDQGIQPGPHTFVASKAGYKPYEVQTDVKPGDTYHVERTLEPTAWESLRQNFVNNQEDVYSKHSYFDINFEMLNVNGDRIVGRRFGNGDDRDATTARLLTPGNSAALYGASVEYGTFGRYFGLMFFGLGYTRNVAPWRVSVQNATAGFEQIDVSGNFLHLRLVQPQVRYAIWRLAFQLQVGLEAWGGFVSELADPPGYSAPGFGLLNLTASGRLSVRAYIVAGLYLQAAYRYTLTLVGFRSAAGENPSSFRGASFGLGYAF